VSIALHHDFYVQPLKVRDAAELVAVAGCEHRGTRLRLMASESRPGDLQLSNANGTLLESPGSETGSCGLLTCGLLGGDHVRMSSVHGSTMVGMGTVLRLHRPWC
jgi:hypothetical protein